MERIAKCVMYYSVAAFFLCLVYVGLTLPGRVGKEIDRQGDATRALIAEQMNKLRETTDKRLASMQSDVNAQIEATRESVDERLASIQDDPKTQIGTIHMDLGPFLEPLRVDLNKHMDSIDKLSESATVTLGSLNDAVRTYQASAPQLYNRSSLLLLHADNLAQRADLALPGFLKYGQSNMENMSGISGDVRRVTDKLTAPTTARGRIWSTFKLLVNPLAWIGTKF